MKNYTEYLEAKLPKEIDPKYIEQFEKYARYVGNGIYEWRGNMSTCTRQLFAMGVLSILNIKFKRI